MFKNIWSVFTQTVTLVVAVFFVIAAFKPEWLDKKRGSVVVIQQAAPPPVSAADGAKHAMMSFRNAASKALPSVVHIYTTQNIRRSPHPFGDDPVFRYFFGNPNDQYTMQQRRSGLGSGVIVSSEGYVLTNYHVIEFADAIEISLSDGKVNKARVVGTDPESDLAVLQIETDPGMLLNLPAITFGKMDSVQVGDPVLAIGNPFGVGQTVTLGIVSALGRSHLGINTFEDFIQTDAAINLGNSGGALVDEQGDLIGINSAIYSRSGGSLGIGFAIPISTAQHVLEQIIQFGTVIRGWAGIEVQNITQELAESFGFQNAQGVLIAGVLNESPAARADIRPGDVLLKIGNDAVNDRQIVLNKIALLKPGEIVIFSMRRNQSTIEVPVTIGKRPAIKQPSGR